MGLLDDYLADARRGLLNTPPTTVPPPSQLPPAPLLVPWLADTSTSPADMIHRANVMLAAQGNRPGGATPATSPATPWPWVPQGAPSQGSTAPLALSGPPGSRAAVAPIDPTDPAAMYPESYATPSSDSFIRNGLGVADIIERVIDAARSGPPIGMRREDVTDIVPDRSPDPHSLLGRFGVRVPRGQWQPGDELVGASTEAALATMGSGVFGAPARAGEALLGAGPTRRLPRSIPEEKAALPAAPAELPKPVDPAAPALPRMTGHTEMLPSGREAPLFEGALPEFAEGYPKAGQWKWKFDTKTGKSYKAKVLTREEEPLESILAAVQRDIDAGNITPYYNPAERYYSDATFRPPMADTRNIRPVRAGTQAKYEAIARSPEATQRIMDAYHRGRRWHEENARDAAALGQLEESFIAELGPEEGRRSFKEFADALGATTAGTKPRANLRMAQYARFQKMKGESMPTAAYDVPFPAGGAYVIPNLKSYQRMLMNSSGLTPATPKGYTFSNEFLGGSGLAIDRRISRLFHPEMDAPPHGTYGHFEAALTDLAKQLDVDPRYFRDMVWAGADEAGLPIWGHNHVMPWITEINEAIERTHRVTGMPRSEIVRRALVRGQIPLYGAGGILAGNKLQEDDDGR